MKESRTRSSRRKETTARRLREMESENRELRQALAAGRKSSDRYIRSLELQEAAIHVVDEKMRILLFNSYFLNWCATLGIPLTENPVGRRVFEIFPFLEKKVAAEYDQVFKTGRPHSVEEKIQVGENRLILHTQKLPVSDEGRITEVITIIRDVTAKRRAEEERRASEERFKILFESAPDATYLSDLQGNFLDGNRAAEDLIGYSREELIGRNYLKAGLLPAGQIPNAGRLLADSALGRIGRARELTLKTKSGLPVTVEIRTMPVKIGGRTQILGIARDISQKKQDKARQARLIRDLQHLSQSAVRFMESTREDDIYSMIGDGLSHLVDGGYVIVNSYSSRDNCIRLEYFSPAEKHFKKMTRIMGRDPREMTFSLDNDAARDRVHRGRLNRVEGGLHEVSFRKIPKSVSLLVEKTFGIQSVYSIGFLNQGVLYGTAVLFLKQRELDNREAVEAFVNQSAVALQKWHAERRIADSLHEKEILLREIHHRVKNNMQIISSLLRLQERSIPDSRVREQLRISQNRIRSMALMHEGLYRSGDLARIDFSRYIRSLVTHLFSMHRVENDTVSLEVSVGEISLDINRAIPCGLLVNELVTNALKHAFPEGRRGRIRVILTEEKGGNLRLTVSDDGVGFPPGRDFRKTETLGLQLINDLTRQLEGRLSLNRENGTEFIISF